MAFTEKSRFVDWTQYDSFSLAKTNSVMSNSYVVSGFTIDSSSVLQGGKAFIGGLDVELSGNATITPVANNYLYLRSVITPGSQNALTGVTVQGTVTTTTLMSPNGALVDTDNTKYLVVAYWNGSAWSDRRTGRMDTVNGLMPGVGTNNLLIDAADINVSHEGGTVTIEAAISDLNSELDLKQDKTDNNLDTADKTVVGAINELVMEKQDKTDNGLNTSNKTVVGAINEVKADSEYYDMLQDDAIAIVNNRVNALPMNGSLKNILNSTVGIPTSFTNIDMFNTKQTVTNYQPLSLDYKGSSAPHIIVMKTIGDYIFDFAIEATHTNGTDTTITLEAWVDGVLYDTATRTLTGASNQVNGITGFFSYSKGTDTTPSEIYFRYKASQANTSANKAMINTNLQGNNATTTFTDTDHVTGINLTEPTYNGATTSFIINDLKSNKLDKSGGTMTGALTLPGMTINATTPNGALNMSNGDITHANAIYFNDTSTNGEGLNFLKTGTISGSIDRADYDCLYALDGKLFLDTKEAIMLQPRIPVGEDLNNLTTPGFYYSAQNTDNCLNVPISGNAFSLLVEKHAGIKQTWTSYSTNNPKTYVRNSYTSGGVTTWGNWVSVAAMPTISITNDEFSQTDFSGNVKNIAVDLYARGFDGSSYSFISYGEAHGTFGRLQQSFNNYMDTQTAKWDNSWYITTAQIMYTFIIPKGVNPTAGEFYVIVKDLNSTHEYTFTCEGDDTVNNIIKPMYTINEKGNKYDGFEASHSLVTFDESKLVNADMGTAGTSFGPNVKLLLDTVGDRMGTWHFDMVFGCHNEDDTSDGNFKKSFVAFMQSHADWDFDYYTVNTPIAFRIYTQSYNPDTYEWFIQATVMYGTSGRKVYNIMFEGDVNGTYSNHIHNEIYNEYGQRSDEVFRVSQMLNANGGLTVAGWTQNTGNLPIVVANQGVLQWGLSTSQFLRSDVNDTMTGRLTCDGLDVTDGNAVNFAAGAMVTSGGYGHFVTPTDTTAGLYVKKNSSGSADKLETESVLRMGDVAIRLEDDSPMPNIKQQSEILTNSAVVRQTVEGENAIYLIDLLENAFERISQLETQLSNMVGGTSIETPNIVPEDDTAPRKGLL